MMAMKNIYGLEVHIKVVDQMQSTKIENEEISTNIKRWAFEVILKHFSLLFLQISTRNQLST